MGATAPPSKSGKIVILFSTFRHLPSIGSHLTFRGSRSQATTPNSKQKVRNPEITKGRLLAILASQASGGSTRLVFVQEYTDITMGIKSAPAAVCGFVAILERLPQEARMQTTPDLKAYLW